MYINYICNNLDNFLEEIIVQREWTGDVMKDLLTWRSFSLWKLKSLKQYLSQGLAKVQNPTALK